MRAQHTQQKLLGFCYLKVILEEFCFPTLSNEQQMRAHPSLLHDG